MLKHLLRDKTGFIAQERVFGALFKANIRELDESVFSTKGINKLVSHLGISFGGILYCRPRMDTPCLYRVARKTSSFRARMNSATAKPF